MSCVGMRNREADFLWLHCLQTLQYLPNSFPWSDPIGSWPQLTSSPLSGSSLSLWHSDQNSFIFFLWLPKPHCWVWTLAVPPAWNAFPQKNHCMAYFFSLLRSQVKWYVPKEVFLYYLNVALPLHSLPKDSALHNTYCYRKCFYLLIFHCLFLLHECNFCYSLYNQLLEWWLTQSKYSINMYEEC